MIKIKNMRIILLSTYYYFYHQSTNIPLKQSKIKNQCIIIEDNVELNDKIIHSIII
jgi:hypothetical protein